MYYAILNIKRIHLRTHMSTHEIDSEIKEMLSPGEEVLLMASQARGVPGGSYYS
jgi:hypothetical protein